MLGLSGIISVKEVLSNIDHSILNIKSIKKPTEPIINKSNRSIFSLQTNRKFENDKVLIENTTHIICIDGVILNKNKLIKEYAEKNYESLLFNLVLKGKLLPSVLKGDFGGFVFEKKTKIITLFTNPAGTKFLYYYKDEDFFIFSTSVKTITNILKKFNKKYHLSEEGAYQIMSFGYMLENQTIIEEVKKCEPGRYYVLYNNQLSTFDYQRFSNSPDLNRSKTKILNTMDELFSEAIKLEYEKDIEYSYKHIATLSGGLDARTSLFYAHKLGYSNITNFTFSQTGHSDEIYARQMSLYLHDPFIFQSLDHGSYLHNIEDNIICNDGLVLYSGAAHQLSMTRNINMDNFGVVHTGAAGDAVLSAFVTKNKNNEFFTFSNLLINKTNIKNIFKKYQNTEMFNLYNRTMNGGTNCYAITSPFSECVSAFFDTEFMQYVISIDPKLRKHRRIYFEWINEKLKESTKVKFEKNNLRPTNLNFKIIRSIPYRFCMMMKYKYFLNIKQENGMNPFNYWYQTNQDLREFINKIFMEKINTIEDASLRNDCTLLFNTNDFISKSLAITFLEVVQYLF